MPLSQGTLAGPGLPARSRQLSAAQLPAFPFVLIKSLLSKSSLFGVFLLRKHKQRWKVKSTPVLFAGSLADLADEFLHNRQL